MKNIIVRIALLFALLATGAMALASADIETRDIKFAKGMSSATVKGSIKGYHIIDYKLGAAAGQTMAVDLKTSNASSYFNVLPPGSDDVAVFTGSTGGNHWKGVLDAKGDYRIRVYLMRSAARRNETADYTLTVGITGKTQSAKGAAAAMGKAPASDAKVPGTDFHATGQVRCSMGDEPKGSQWCDFGVIRGKSGNAEVQITPKGGLTRVLYFTGDKVSSDGDNKVKAVKQGDEWSVEVNDYEHYQIVEAVIVGG